MPKVGEAWYELDARDDALFRKIATAEGRVKAGGTKAEQAFGGSVAKGVAQAETAVAGGTARMGGMFGRMGGDVGRLTGTVDNLKMGLVQGLGIGGFMAVSSAASMFIGKITDSVGLASDLNETVSKSVATFGASAGVIAAWAKTASGSFGLSEKSALDFSATFGGLLMNFGQTPPKAAEMSQSLVELAADMASFSNTNIEDALAAIQSGLVGEQEPLRRFQVNINEARIQAKALELGLWDGKGALDASAKSAAIYGIIMSDTARQQGDFAKTADGLANASRTAAAKQEEAWTRFGAALLPIANVVIPAITGAGTALIDFLAMLLTHGRELVPVLVGAFIVLAPAIWSLVAPTVAWAAATVVATAPLIAIGLAVAGVVLVLHKLGLLGPIIDAFWNVIGAGAQLVGVWFDAVIAYVKGFVGTLLMLVENVIGIAAAIPGPWQEAATAMKGTLAGMRADVDKWGTDTSAMAGVAGEEIVKDFTGGMKAGEPAVSAAADGTLKQPVVGAVGDAKKEAVEKAREIPSAIADSLREGRTSVGSAGDALKQAFKDAISPTKEIAFLEGELSGKELQRALRSKNPEIRAAGEAYKAAVEERLFALRNGVGAYALKTGQNYADALRSKRDEAGKAAAANASRVQSELRLDKAETWGKHAGREWADGLASMAYYAAKAAKEYASGARGALEFTIPKEGPLRGMNTWGQHAGQSWAEGFASQADYLKRSVGKFATGIMPSASGFSPIPTIPDRIVADSIGGLRLADRQPTAISIGDINLPIYFTGSTPSSPTEIRDLSRALGEEVRLGLIRTPDLFPVRGG